MMITVFGLVAAALVLAGTAGMLVWLTLGSYESTDTDEAGRAL